MKTMCPTIHHHNCLVASHAFGHMMCTYAQVYELPQNHSGDNGEGTLLLFS